jgi:tetratricopeptide (TPR) repeat protein
VASRQALDIANELGDRSLQIEAKYRLAQAHFALGDLRQAAPIFLETIQAFADESAEPAPLAQDATAPRVALPPFFGAWPHAWLGLLFSHLGRFREALEHAQHAMQIAEQVNHPHTVIEAHAALGGVSLDQGDLGVAQHVFNAGSLLRSYGGDADLRRAWDTACPSAAFPRP